MNFKFPEKIKINENGEIAEWEELDNETKWELIDHLSDEVQIFIDENLDIPEFNENEEELKKSSNTYEHPVDEVYSIFKEWCKEKGIAPINKHTFTQRIGYTFPKGKKRISGKLTYVFTNMIFKNDSDLEHLKKFEKICRIINLNIWNACSKSYHYIIIPPLLLLTMGV